ncbi:hypothetical protein GIW45_25500 [Pseudomonas congelans]|uniref:hypothetical protein n=1 Tax=Pseudomonas congelans TaxID=200452 RepID=UPI001F362166|nr:hypothetical protein [Pseudomonas congelans]MCF5167316.1 hypothetical protein [Pseudomonas congelans]
MNPIRSGLLPQRTAVPVNAGQPLRASDPQAQPRHSPKLSLAGMSKNTLLALEQSNEQHEPLAMLAIGSIADSAMSFQSAIEADAHFATPDGSLTVHARLNDQSRYDIISISSGSIDGRQIGIWKPGR